MYGLILGAHNITRWAVLILGIITVLRAFMGWIGKKEWELTDIKLGKFYSMAIDIQLLLGLILYFVLSPITKQALIDFGSVMNNEGTRFFAFEHALFMLIAVVLVHLGNILPRKTQDVRGKHRLAAIIFSLSLIIILLGMPWSRSLLPSFA